MPPKPKLNKGYTLMFLAIANGNRGQAAFLAGVSTSTFYRSMNKNHIKAPRGQWLLSPVDVLTIRKLYDDGMTMGKIAESLGVHRHTIERAVHRETFKQVR